MGRVSVPRKGVRVWEWTPELSTNDSADHAGHGRAIARRECFADPEVGLRVRGDWRVYVSQIRIQVYAGLIRTLRAHVWTRVKWGVFKRGGPVWRCHHLQ